MPEKTFEGGGFKERGGGNPEEMRDKMIDGGRVSPTATLNRRPQREGMRSEADVWLAMGA